MGSGNSEVVKMIFLKNCKGLNQSGLVKLPKKWRIELGYISGNVVVVFIRKSQIVITHMEDESTTDNVRFITSNGSITIPKEIRVILGENNDALYCLYVDKVRGEFILIPEWLL